MDTGHPRQADRALALVESIYPPHLINRLQVTPPPSPAKPRTKPFVTLTYAQSLDGKIAAQGGTQLQLSGPDSMRLTHQSVLSLSLSERSHWVTDICCTQPPSTARLDPRRRRHRPQRRPATHRSALLSPPSPVLPLSAHSPSLPPHTARLPTLLPLSHQPRPVILDSSLRTPPSAKLVRNAHRGISHAPVVVHRALDPDAEGDRDARHRAEQLTRAGAVLLPLEADGASRLVPLSFSFCAAPPPSRSDHSRVLARTHTQQRTAASRSRPSSPTHKPRPSSAAPS